MTKTHSVAIRLDDVLSERIEAAKRRLVMRVPGMHVSWSDVVRGLIEAGLERDEADPVRKKSAR